MVLGPCGRNFGAGMSGGVAYVYDPANTFAQVLNPEMVDLDLLEEEDRAFLREVITTHFAETDSTVAHRILVDFRNQTAHFRKVMPKDYKRVLEAKREAVETGIEADQAVMAAAHG